MGNHTWEVDIGFMFIVNHVLIYERSDGTDQLSGFLVIIGNNSNPWRTEMALQKSHSTRHKYILFADYTLARFVSVIRQNSTTLTLCEVEVYGECLHGKYSEFCNLTCGQCSNGEPCNKDTGECLNGCKPGWTGKLCDKGVRNFALNKFAYQSSTEYYNKFYWTADKAVDGNTDGRNPDFSRTCSETDIRMGIHTWEVDIGFMIIVKHVVIYERSDRKCSDGMYSEFCNRTYGQCSNGDPCNRDTGECFRGCEPGWTGTLCDKVLRNFALNKSAYQSSTLYFRAFNWTADKAVDGNTDGRYPGTSRTCSKTEKGIRNQSWEVDIGFLLIVNHVVIYDRSDGMDELSGFQVCIGNHSNQRNTSKPLLKKQLSQFRYRCIADNFVARFVSVIRPGKRTISLCEVEVYGECLDGMYSEFCNRTCGQCTNREPCDKDTGECHSGCEPGWTGVLCDKDSSAKLTQTLSRADLTVIGGSVAGACVGAIIIIIIIIAVLKRGRNTDTGGTEMEMNETGVNREESFGYTVVEEIMSPSDYSVASSCIPTTTASRDGSEHAVAQITEAKYEKFQDRGQIESFIYSIINDTETGS
ncbi:hypothetical protein ACJMK2_031603 [Sinanodonta woodiana]|uniref:Fucolectin tachylectin-4 pentraxin-1 domain-containing protein n=1 Tax=Sinanodonta woodiana TaxID=1069815 RepID=A0ABD3WZA6_SINWO